MSCPASSPVQRASPTEPAIPTKSTTSRNSNYSVQIQTKLESQFEFGPRDTEESEFLDVVDFEGVAISVESVIAHCLLIRHTRYQPQPTCRYDAGLAVMRQEEREVGGWGRDPKKCTGRDWGTGSSTI